MTGSLTRRCRVLIPTFLLSFFIASTAGAHSLTELDEWYADWESRTEQGLTLELVAEVSDMMDRHPTYLPPGFRHSPDVASYKATSPSSGSSSGMGSNWEQWRPLVSAYFPASQVDFAVCIIQYESGGNPTAVNPSSGAAGLFQIMPFWWETYGGDRFDPTTNVALAAVIWSDYGWGAWSAASKC